MTTIERDLQRLMTAVAELPAPEIRPDMLLCNWRLVRIHDRPGARPFRRLVGRRYSEGYPVVGLRMSSPVEHIDLARRLVSLIPCDIATWATDIPGSLHCASTIALNWRPYRRLVFALSLVIVSTYSYVDTILPGRYC